MLTDSSIQAIEQFQWKRVKTKGVGKIITQMAMLITSACQNRDTEAGKLRCSGRIIFYGPTNGIFLLENSCFSVIYILNID